MSCSSYPIALLRKADLCLHRMSSKLDPEFVKALESDDFTLPKEWQNDEGEPGDNIKEFVQDWPKYQAYYESLGVPCYRVVEGESRMQPCLLSSLQLETAQSLKHEVDQEFITMFRSGFNEANVDKANVGKANVDNANVDQVNIDGLSIHEATVDQANVDQKTSKLSKSTIVRRLVGGSIVEVELIIIPMTEVDTLKAEGWEV